MDKLNTLIVIPARYGSKRLPGKPLLKIHGRTMLERVYNNTLIASNFDAESRIVIATDDKRIESHCKDIGAPCVMTGPECDSGTQRACEAAGKTDKRPTHVLNVQGDTPIMPPVIIQSMLKKLRNSRENEALTPVTRLSWEGLRALRQHKKNNPFSGTTAIVGKDGKALWFSKNIIPAMRAEKREKATGGLSPVYRHIGIYGYPMHLLEKFVALPQSNYERLEGLEQLRLLENGIDIRTVGVKMKNMEALLGVDTRADLERVHNWISTHGDPFDAQ